MKRLVYKFTLQAAVPVLCAVIAVNAYVIFKNLKQIEGNIGLRLGTAEMQKNISQAAADLQTMETSQRGYLLTGDASCLAPFQETKQWLADDLGRLRSGLSARDRAEEARLETVAEAKISEMEETIRLRQQGYRHRAFLIVGSNRGQRLMEESRASLDALRAAQSKDMARYDAGLSASVSKAVKDSALANAALLLMAIATFAVFQRYRSGLERGYESHDRELRATKLRLEELTSAIFHDGRSSLMQIREHANKLLEGYGSYLPRQGCETVERIGSGAEEMIRVLDELSGARAARSAQEQQPAKLESLTA